MHEMSIVEALLETIRHKLESYPGANATVVYLRVGELRLVEPSTLEFCFQSATRGTPLENSRLSIERVPARVECDDCHQSSDAGEDGLLCPKCGSLHTRLLCGNELLLTGLTIENVDDATSDGGLVDKSRATPAATAGVAPTGCDADSSSQLPAQGIDEVPIIVERDV